MAGFEDLRMPVYLLVTGSRSWRDRATIQQALRDAVAALQPLWTPSTTLVLLSGGAEGADGLTETCWEQMGFRVQRDRPDWNGPCQSRCQPGHRQTNRSGREYCPGAGFYRNEKMVQRGPKLCLSFLMPCKKYNCPKKGRHDSHGTAQCMELAIAAGITVWPYRA